MEARPAYDKLIFELSAPDRFAHSLPALDVPPPPPFNKPEPPPRRRTVLGAPIMPTSPYQWAMLIAVIATVGSAWGYISAFWHTVRSEPTPTRT